MARTEIKGIYKHAPLTDTQISGTKRNLDRELIIKRTAITDRGTLNPGVTDNTTNSGAFPTNYIYAMDYDSTDDGGINPNIRRHIPTLELFGSKGSNDDNGGVVGSAGSSWINIETTGTYSALTGGQTLQAALEALDAAAAGAVLKYIIDGSTVGSLSLSLDGVNQAVTNNGGDYQIALGKTCTIDTSSNSVILGGIGNAIQSDNIYSTKSFISSGENNIIWNSSDSSIIGGINNYINANQSSIISGYGQYIKSDTISGRSSNQSILLGGINNYIEGGVGSGILGGEYNILRDVSYSVIANGQWNYIVDNYNAFIGSGIYNYINTYNSYAFIGAGESNTIEDKSSGAFIGGGFHNYIYTNAIGSGIVAGFTNTISIDTIHALIGAGTNNIITAISSYAFIGGGEHNSISNSITSSIIGGNVDILLNTPYSFIGGGEHNSINLIDYSDDEDIQGFNGIVSGKYNIIETAASSILSGIGNRLLGDAFFSSISGGAGNQINGGVTGSYNILQSVVSITQVGGVATLVTKNKHNYTGIIPLTIVGADQSEYNLVNTPYTTIDDYTLTYTVDSSAITPATGTINTFSAKTSTGAFSFIGSGTNNLIVDSTLSSILGGNTNVINGYTNAHIIGSNITANRDNATFINALTLWDKELELTGEIPSVGDVPVVQSINGNVATIGWGTGVDESSNYYGINRISDSTYIYNAMVGGSSAFNTNYVTIFSGNSSRNLTIPMNEEFNKYTYTDMINHFTYSDVFDYSSDALAGTNIIIEDGYNYEIKLKDLTAWWTGEYATDDITKLIDDVSDITIHIATRDTDYSGYSGNIAGHRSMIIENTSSNVPVLSNTVDAAIIDNGINSTVSVGFIHTAMHSADTDHELELFVQFNATTKKLMIGISHLYYDADFLKQPEANGYYANTDTTYDLNKLVINGWPSSYSKPQVGDKVYVWNLYPKDNAPVFNGLVLAELSYSDAIMLDISYAGVDVNPCWIQVDARVPYIHSSLTFNISKVLYSDTTT